MKNGYQQYFKKAQQVAQASVPPKNPQTKQVEQLRQKIKQKKVKKKYKIPWKFAGFSFLGVIIAAYGLQKEVGVEHYIKKIEVSFFGKARAEEVKPDVKTEHEKSEKLNEEKEKKSEPVVGKELTEEQVNHFTKLNDRKKELDAREEELNKMEAELQKQKEELDKRMGELDNTRRQIASTLEDKVKVDEKKVETLVQVYSNMKPQQAAKVFESMDEDLAIEILGRMKRKPAAEILNLVKAEKAQILSEKYAGYKHK